MTTKEDQLYAVTRQIRTLFHKMAATIDALHEETGITAGMRAVLEMLSTGDKTVPEMARLRHVSRQHIQLLVNDLDQHGLVETKDNPAHKRSSLIATTPKGTKAFTAMRKREAGLIKDAAKRLVARDLEATAGVLSELDQFFANFQQPHT